ncbi:ammonium transporter [Parasphingopyxis algicola]|uniref:ammonium transporter n=1 Tax=Parasphingopyxis algicola TaxID=2026624 RepID=UPI0015A28C15|nr:ammonium transporter [Parasphingopyxis algicola]QLC23877.1 ammonium transporter [Parasphingopyxis algicola]
MHRIWNGIAAAILASTATGAAHAQPGFPPAPVVVNSGDTAWILTASALVLLMTLPGLVLFYGGLVRTKNFLSVVMQCFGICCVASLIWVTIGYSLVFSEGGAFVGGTGLAMLSGLGEVFPGTTIPESSFVLFQMTFAIITPALMVGAWVERARFGWVMVFTALWLLVVYIPVAHWIWGGGWLAALGALDFAGGIVVHTTAGFSALVIALLLGRRGGFPKKLIPPHGAALTMTGAALLWVGWFGFNGGSGLVADFGAGSAILNTHVAASTAALTWAAIEKIRFGKSTGIGVATGVIAGLATITPAANVVGPGGAILLGLLAGIICFGAVGLIKRRFAIDDSLDVFAVHGVGGMLGAAMLAILMAEGLGGTGYAPGVTMTSQLVSQLTAIGVVALWSLVATAGLAWITGLVFPMRATEEQEQEGLDLSQHGEKAWDWE